NELASLKQHFFLRKLRLSDTRLRILGRWCFEGSFTVSYRCEMNFHRSAIGNYRRKYSVTEGKIRLQK
ncbi:hypothetical protein, partial [Flavobacterium sp.]|uniref:hypothetical protein n=1 Tax=Flavobacterium sp. TaxID=239 RepID=UPI003D6B340A